MATITLQDRKTFDPNLIAYAMNYVKENENENFMSDTLFGLCELYLMRIRNKKPQPIMAWYINNRSERVFISFM